MLSRYKTEKFATKMGAIGVFVFLYIIFYSIILLREEMNIMNWILLLIGIGGLLVDSFVVFETRIKNVK